MRNGDENKVYICLFTCAVSRALHLEIVTDLTVETFLQAFRRFSSHKSLPKILISDNASTYMAAAAELLKLFNSPLLTETLTRKGVVWKFIPKRSGGFRGARGAAPHLPSQDMQKDGYVVIKTH